MKPSDDPSWSCYGDTLIELFDDGSLVLDIRKPIPEKQRRMLAASPIGERFAIMTAFNPAGRDHSAGDNEARDRRLRAELTERGVPWVCADGWSPDHTHREPGVAVAVPKEEAIEIARAYAQSAIYWYDAGTMWLVGALVDTPPERLPRDRAAAPA